MWHAMCEIYAKYTILRSYKNIWVALYISSLQVLLWSCSAAWYRSILDICGTQLWLEQGKVLSAGHTVSRVLVLEMSLGTLVPPANTRSITMTWNFVGCYLKTCTQGTRPQSDSWLVISSVHVGFLLATLQEYKEHLNLLNFLHYTFK